MGAILTIASSKGGNGKTTLTMILAACLVARGYSVAMVDGDPNQTLSDWHSANYEGHAITSIAEMDHVAIVARAQDAAETHDVVLIDTAGFANLTAASAIGAADAVLIPCMADRGSVRETMRTAAQVASLSKAARRSIPSLIIRTSWNPRGMAERWVEADFQDAQLTLAASIIPVLAVAKQATFTGVVPTSGRLGETGDALISELAALKFIPALRKKVTRHD